MNLFLLSSDILNEDKINYLKHIFSASEINVVGVAILNKKLKSSQYSIFKKKVKRWGIQKVIMNYIMTLIQKRFHDSELTIIAEKYYEKKDVPFIKTEKKYSSEVLRFIKSTNPDALFRVGWGIIKEPLLSISPIGILSYHHGDMRKYRGQPPGFWQLYNNEREEKVTIQILDKGLDCGAIVSEVNVPIYSRDSYKSFNRRLYASSYDLAAKACKKLSNNYNPQKISESELGHLYTTPTFYQWVKFNLRILYRRIE